MADLIQKLDSLNQGRGKINKSIEASERAENKSDSAVNTSTEARDIAQTAEGKADSVQTQFNQVVIGGDSSIEAAQARVDADGNAFDTLKKRLDEKETGFNRQLAHKAPKDETELALIALDAKIDGREPPEPIIIENLWNTDELVSGLLSTTSGNLNPSTSMETTPFKDVVPNQVYSASAASTTVAIDFRFVFYDENNNFLSAVADTLGDNFGGWHKTVIAPDNASKMRVSSANSTRDLFVVNIGSEPMGEAEGDIWDGGFWDGIPTPPLRDGSVRENHLSTELRGKIESGGGSGDGGTGGDLGQQHIYDDSSVYSIGQEKIIADIENKSVVDLIEFSSDGTLSELQIFYKENDGTEFLYDLVSSAGTDSVPNTFENMQLHGSSIAEFIEFDDRNNVYKVNTKDLKFANGFLIKVKNNDSVEKNISVRVVSRQYV